MGVSFKQLAGIGQLKNRKRTMKKSELKNIIKECVKEVIFEEGILSGIITEVAAGLNTAQGQVISAQKSPHSPNRKDLQETRKKVLSVVGGDAYANIKKQFPNPELFEGTTPLPTESGHTALGGVSPADAGVDISSIPGFGTWGAVNQRVKEDK